MHFVFRITLFSLVVLLAALATLPWWLGPVLRRTLAGRGISFERYERVGYARFALLQVELVGPTWKVAVDRVEADTPLLWTWRHWRQQGREITAGNWSVVVRPAGGPAAADAGWAQLHGQLLAIGRTVEKFVPRLRSGPGRVEWPGQELQISQVDWADGTLRLADVKTGRWHGPVELTWPRAGTSSNALILRTALPDQQVRLELRGTSEQLDGNLTLQGQKADLTAVFAVTGWMPQSARLLAADWSLPGSTVGTGDHYQTWRGQGRMEWKSDRFVADLDVVGDPATASDRPTVKAVVRASGDLAAISIDALDISVPGLQARLSDPVRIWRDGRVAAGAAVFTLAGDLSQLPGGFQSGRIEGEARVAAGAAVNPDVLLSFTADDVVRGDFRVPRLAAEAVLSWPLLKVNRGRVELSPTESIAFTGTLNLTSQEIVDAETSGFLEITRLEPWLGRPVTGDPMEFSAHASGPWLKPAHEGRARVKALTFAPLKPLTLAAEWSGSGLELSSVQVTAQAGTSRVAAAGAVGNDRASLSALTWTRDEVEQLRLAGPVVIELRPALTTGPFELSGPLGSLQGRWTGGDQSRLAVNLKDITSRQFSDFIDLPGPPWSVPAGQASVTWNGSVLDFSVRGTARFEEQTFGDWAVTASARSTPDGVQVDEFNFEVAGDVVARGTAQLPITLRPAAPVAWEARETGPIVMELSAEPTGALLAWLNKTTGFDWTTPRLTGRATGTWAAPVGELRAGAGRLARAPGSRMPGLDDLSLTARFTTDGLDVEDLSAQINGQALRLSGRLRRPAVGWMALVKDPRAAVRDAIDLDLTLPETDLMFLGRDLVGSFITQGRVAGNLKLTPGAGAKGAFRLTDITTRPIGSLGAIQDVSVDLQLQGDDLVLPAVTGTLGGQQVRIAGRVDGLLADEPEFDLTLQGANLPLVRQPGLLVRADLDLRLASRDGRQPGLTGSVGLRQSLLLADIRDLFGRGGSAGTRAPYFSVEEEGLRDWTLAVQINGDRFLRIRSPIFNGVASAHFKLSGTLGDPRATGEVGIDQGFVILPYASFKVQQGSAELSPLHEFDPKLSLRGTARSLGYDLRMELSGTVSAPQVVFSSSPTLSAEEALRLVLAGQAPRNEISYSTSQRASQIGSILGQQVLAGMSQNPERESTLSIMSGSNISNQGRETYSIEYKFDQQWSLLGEYDEFDQYNLDLKWKLPFGRGARTHAEK